VPPKNPKPCRDLTEEQIREEMKKMYAFPDEKDADESLVEDSTVAEVNTDSKLEKKKLKKVLRFSEVTEEIKTQAQNVPENGVRTEAIRDSPTAYSSNGKVEFNGKALKRKQMVPSTVHDGSGDYYSGVTSDNLQNLNPAVSADVHHEINNTPLKSPVPYSTKVIRGKKSSKKKTPRKFSFGYGDESQLSPIRGESLGGCKIDSPVPVPKYEQASRPTFSPGSSNSAPTNPVSISLDDLKLVWREIETRRQLLEERQSNDKDLIIEDLGNVPASEIDSLDSKEAVANAASGKIESCD